MTELKSLLAYSLATAGLLAGCGGGGGDPGAPASVVTASSTSTAMYGKSMLVSLTGSNLDQGLSLTSTGCRDFVRSTSAPNISSASTAYYTCTTTGVGALQVNVARASDASTAATVAYTVAVPQVTVTINTGLPGISGSFVITLAPDKTPATVNNFLAYVNSGYYNGTVFHRHGRDNALQPFVLQGGGYAGPIAAGGALPTAKAASAPVALEVGKGLSNLRFSVAMARTGALDSATSQFFINLVDNVFLDTSGGGYAVFGTITTGTAFVTTMTTQPCTAWPEFFGSGIDCLPQPNFTISSAEQTR